MNAFKEQYGPVALVTGASSGIGKSFAENLAGQGFDLVLAARRVERLNELAAKLQTAHGVRVIVLEADLANASSAQTILDATSALDLGLVVSNAGFGTKGPFENDDPAVLRDMLAVNCETPMLLAHGFIPRLKSRGKGGIIFTSSVEGLIGCPYSAAYSASKALVKALGEALWAEMQPHGIDVLTLCPGATETEAAAKQGIDLSKMQNVMAPEEVVKLTLENIQNGPTFISSAHYKALFEQLAAMPRRDALLAMAKGMRG